MAQKREMNSAQNLNDKRSEINQDRIGERNSVKRTEAESNIKPSQSRVRFRHFCWEDLPRNQCPDTVDGKFECQFGCWPPPFAIVMFTVVQVSIFFIYGEKVSNSPLIYDPAKRDEAWRFISYMLIHTSTEHITGNAVLQLLFGIPLEMVHKFWGVSAIYLCGVLAASLATSICDPAIILVGASGGVYALITAYITSIILNFGEKNFGEKNFYLVVKLTGSLFIMVAAVAVEIYEQHSETNDRTAYSAHWGGALAGLLMGILVSRNLRKFKREKVVRWLCFFTLFIVMGAMIVWNLAAPSHFPTPK